MMLPPESGKIAEVEVEEGAFLGQEGLAVVEVQKWKRMKNQIPVIK